MLLEFKTSRNKTNGSRKYLAIDTEAHCYSTFCPYMIVPGIEIKLKDMKELIEKCEFYDFEKKNRCF